MVDSLLFWLTEKHLLDHISKVFNWSFMLNVLI